MKKIVKKSIFGENIFYFSWSSLFSIQISLIYANFSHYTYLYYFQDKLIIEWNADVTINGTTKARKIYRLTDENTPYSKVSHLQDPFTDFEVNAFDIFHQCRLLFTEKLFADTALIKELRAENYDLALVAPFDGSGLPLAHVLGIRATALYVATSSGDYVFEGLGIPTPPSYISCKLL